MVRRGEDLPEVIYRKHSPLISSDPSPWVRQPARYLPLFILLVCLSCIITAIDLRYGFRWLATGIGNLSGPVVHSIDLLIAPISRSAGFIQETFSARRENTTLRARIEELEGQVHAFQDASEENQRLRELLDLKAEAAPKAVAAEVLRYRDEAAQRILTLRAGKLENLSLGQPVLTQGGQLLGRIVALTDRVSTVRLITDAACSIGVTLEKTQSQGILYSRDGNLFVRLDRAELVPQNERVLTSHLSDLFPEGLLVGVIEGEAEANDKDPFVAAELGLMKSYRVRPVHPVEEWPRIREVLCLPLWNTTETQPQAEVKP